MPETGLLCDLQGYVDGARERYAVPALSIAAYHGGRLSSATSGVLNVDTGVEATVDSVFQIGSVSKVFTASLVMLLVDEGRVDLDRPVKHYLKDFHVLDPRATQAITVRHLLSHTSGLASDSSFLQGDADDTGNAIARYVDRCFLLPQVHDRFGERFSYSNAGYVMAGRLIEAVAGTSWRKAVEERIFQPLGMAHSLANPANVLRFRAAIGHLLTGERGKEAAAVVSMSYLPMSMAPTGSVLTMSASDLLRFGLAHWNGGRAASGLQWMSEKSVRAMQEAQVSLPAPPLLSERSWGLGWALSECQDVRMFGHSGGTAGQQAFLGIIPECEAAFAVLLNGMTSSGSAATLKEIAADVLHQIAGVRAEKPRPCRGPSELARFTGKYGLAGFRLDIMEHAGKLRGRVEAEGYADLPAQLFDLSPVDESRFLAHGQDGAPAYDFVFLEPDSRGVPEYLFYGYRLHRRYAPLHAT
jgi:CubicO group peptidase (beta-lactamase class C family)